MKLFSLQDNGHCYCKSNVCGDSCDTCEAGYYALENKNYFGCQGKMNKGHLQQHIFTQQKSLQNSLGCIIKTWMYLSNHSCAQHFALWLVIACNLRKSSFGLQREQQQGICSHCGSQSFCASFMVLHLTFAHPSFTTTCLRFLCQNPH